MSAPKPIASGSSSTAEASGYSLFEALPDDIIIRIFEILARDGLLQDFAHLRATSRRFRLLSESVSACNVKLSEALTISPLPRSTSFSCTFPSDPSEGDRQICTIGCSDNHFAIAYFNGRVRIVNMEDRCLGFLPDEQSHQPYVACLAFSPHGSQLVTAGFSPSTTIKIWDVRELSYLGALGGHLDRVQSLVFSPDGSLLASGSHDRTVKIWNVAARSCVVTLHEHVYRVWSLAFSPDGSLLVSGSLDGTAKIWNVTAHSCVATLDRHHTAVCCLAFSPDGSLLVSGSSDGTVKIWNMSKQSCEVTLEGHTGGVTSLLMSPDQPLFAAGSRDGSIRIWHLYQHNCMAIMRFHRGPVGSMVLTHKALVSFSNGGTRHECAGVRSGSIKTDQESD